MRIQNLTIPEEIQQEIITYLFSYFEPRVFLNYALISKSWLILIRRTYFQNKDVVIGNHQPGSFRRVLTLERVNDSHSMITPFLRVFAIVGPEANPTGHIQRHQQQEYDLFERAVSETASLLRFQIVNLSISSLKWSSLTPGTIQMFGSFPRVRNLRIYTVTFGNISELTNFITPTIFPELQNLTIYQSKFGDGRTRVDLQGHSFPTFMKYIAIETRPRISLWLWSLKNQECQITGLSVGTLQNREQEEAVKAIIRIAGPKLQRLSADYILPPESDQPPFLLEGNTNLSALRIGTFSALSKSSNAIRPMCALIDSISSITMTHFEVAIDFPEESGPKILAESQEWVQLENKLVRHQDQQGSTRVNWKIEISRPPYGPRTDTMPIQRAFRRIFRKLDLTGRLYMNSEERPGEKGFEVWM